MLVVMKLQYHFVEVLAQSFLELFLRRGGVSFMPLSFCQKCLVATAYLELLLYIWRSPVIHRSHKPPEVVVTDVAAGEAGAASRSGH